MVCDGKIEPPKLNGLLKTIEMYKHITIVVNQLPHMNKFSFLKYCKSL